MERAVLDAGDLGELAVEIRERGALARDVDEIRAPADQQEFALAPHLQNVVGRHPPDDVLARERPLATVSHHPRIDENLPDLNLNDASRRTTKTKIWKILADTRVVRDNRE